MNAKKFVIQTLIAFVTSLYLQLVLIFVNKIKKNRKHKKAAEALGWSVEYVHHPLVARFLKRRK